MNLRTPETLFLVGLTAYLLVRVGYQRRYAGSKVHVSSTSSIDRLLIFLVIAGQIIIPLTYIFSPILDAANYRAQPLIVSAGTVIWIGGLWLFWRSHADLGRNWGVSLSIQVDHALVSGGVYRAIRHPMYLSFIVFGIAQVMILPNIIAGLAALVATAILCLFRIPREEAMMAEYFGQAYLKYRQNTGGIIPWPSNGK
jgi:protein-S-isoprenylcysteine O-methyltransferase Ste14